jgi:hypothetical protein
MNNGSLTTTNYKRIIYCYNINFSVSIHVNANNVLACPYMFDECVT